MEREAGVGSAEGAVMEERVAGMAAGNLSVLGEANGAQVSLGEEWEPRGVG